MNGKPIVKIALALALLPVGTIASAAWAYYSDLKAQERPQQETLRLQVSVGRQTLRVKDIRGHETSYTVKAGSLEHPTPLGTYNISKIVWKDGDQKESPKGDGNSPDEEGVRIFFQPGYFIGSREEGKETLKDGGKAGSVLMALTDANSVARAVLQAGGARDASNSKEIISGKSRIVILPRPVALEVVP